MCINFWNHQKYTLGYVMKGFENQLPFPRSIYLRAIKYIPDRFYSKINKTTSFETIL